MIGRDASLSRRLLAGAGVFIAVALVIAGVVIFFVLHHFVRGQIDQRLDTQIAFLSSALRVDADGILSLAGNADGPPFDRPERGWYWEVIGARNALASQSLRGARLDVPERGPRPPSALPPGHDKRPGPPPRSDHPEPADGPGPNGEPLHFRIHRAASGAPVTVIATAPRAAIFGPLREAMTTLALSLFVLGAALAAAMLVQVRLGLRPLEALRRSIADVRAGRVDRVPAAQPHEVQPLVTELNALLEQNAANLERARRHVANLAHGLKTPLATLSVALPREPGVRGDIHDLVDLMERRIRHHLGRARTAALSGPVRAQAEVAVRIADLGSVMGKLYADRAVRFEMTVPADLAVACEPQDLDEMAGNLLDNAFRFAHGRVAVVAGVRDGRWVELTVEDDGPGLTEDQIRQVLQPGQRLDESGAGFGFGLPITRELAELYGGSLDLQPSAAGGLRVRVRLPAPPVG